MHTTLEARPLGTTSLPARRAAFNEMTRDDAIQLVQPCLAVERWWTALVDGRPYPYGESLFATARSAASPMTSPELAAAVAHHLRTYSAAALLDTRHSTHLPAGELAPAAVIRRLDEGLHRYQQRFGRPFILRTAGRSTADITYQLEARLTHDLGTEDQRVASELRQIAVLALAHRITHL